MRQLGGLPPASVPRVLEHLGKRYCRPQFGQRSLCASRELEDAKQRGIAGENVGSCPGLLRELAMVAPALGIRLEGGQLSDAEAARVYAASTRKEGPCWREQVAWLALWEKARTAMRHGAMLALT